MRILFARHAESEANVNRIYSNRGWKHPLTNVGLQQAAALAKALSTQNITAIYTSPIQRAVQTAQAISDATGIPRKIEPASREYDVGIYEDRDHASGAHDYDTIANRWIAGDLDCRIQGGESCREIRARFVPFIQRLVQTFSTQPSPTLILVSHGGTLRHALPAVLSNLTDAQAASRTLKNTDYVEAHLRDQELVCVRWAEESFI